MIPVEPLPPARERGLAPNPTASLRRAVAHLDIGETLPFPAAARASTPPGSFLDVLDMVPTRLGPGAATATMRIGAQHLDATGVGSSAVIAAFADAVAGWATFGLLDEDRWYTTLEAKLEVFAMTEFGDEPHATARPLHVGRTTCVFVVDVVLPADDAARSPEPIARFSCTQLVMGRR